MLLSVDMLLKMRTRYICELEKVIVTHPLALFRHYLMTFESVIDLLAIALL